jgi:hypothetical protein
MKITIGPFRIFPKIRRDIRKSRCTTGVNDDGGNFAIKDTSDKFAPLPLVSLTPVANLPTVSTTPVENCHRYQRHNKTGVKFATGVNDTEWTCC